MRTIPKRPMLDTSFIIDVNDKKPIALAVMKRLHGRVLLVSTVTWAELGGGKEGPAGIERARGLEPISFDTAAATFLATFIPPKRRPPEADKIVWTADAMIYACAVAGRADAIIT